MNTPKFSPGPWSVDERYSPASGILDANGFSVATVDNIGINAAWQEANPNQHWGSGGDASKLDRAEAEIEANAYLLAAAWSMRATLRRIQAELRIGNRLNTATLSTWVNDALTKTEGR